MTLRISAESHRFFVLLNYVRQSFHTYQLWLYV